MILKGTATLFSHLSPCHAEVDCGHPGAPPHATMSGEKFTSGSTVRFSCSGERQLIGDSSLSCQLSGHWSAPLPHCSGAPTHKQIGSLRRPDTHPRAASESELLYLSREFVTGLQFVLHRPDADNCALFWFGLFLFIGNSR